MCRNLISVDWQGYVYDCDFNQMLDLPLAHPPSLKLRRADGQARHGLGDGGHGGRERAHLSDLLDAEIEGEAIRVAGHCYGCTAGQGSSCGGALKEAAE